MEGSCSGSSAEDDIDIMDALLPRFLKDLLGENRYKQQEEENCELCPAELIWDLPGTGKMSTLSDSDREAIVSNAKDEQCFFKANEDHEIRKATTDVKKESDLISKLNTRLKNSRWQILFYDNFRKSFQKLSLTSTQKSVIKILMDLAKGWSPKVNVDWTCEKSSYILKQVKVDKYYVVCSVDIVKESVYKQVLKVWDILPMTETTKLLKKIDSIASSYTDEFINHCNEKSFDGVEQVPMTWPLSSEIIRLKNPSNTKLVSGADTGSVENSKVSERSSLMKFYDHLLSDVEVDLPCGADEERKIIHFHRSSFILGRSGTGKTTILTTKLYKTFQKYIDSQGCRAADGNVSITDEVDVGGPVLRQMFVTVSPMLCHAVKKSLARLQSNFTGVDNVDEVSEFEDIPDTFVGIRHEKYPLIITFQKFLMMLDGTFGKSYFQRFPCVKDSSHSEGKRSVALQTFMRKNEVTYDRFSSIYWPQFNTKQTKGLDASRVFTEIMSHIKGGPLEGKAYNIKRSRQEYLSLSENRTSTLSKEQRRAIYDIFQDYEKIKLKHCEFDLADFVIDIHKRLKTEGFQGDKMDFVYIDEVQDLTMKQISLFKHICRNVDKGFVFSGDTAQTIARGIDFRFEDIRSLFYNEFLMEKEKGSISDTVKLSHNFRTHNGVLKLAESVINLISRYFPHSIDVLDPESSRIDGESPIVLEPGSDENMIISIFGHSGKSSGSGKWVGFGADQAILVRDESAKRDVSKFIGNKALILTILECKGLEFQDVLLYNFFGSSQLSNQWRLVYGFLKEKDLLDDNSAISYPSFSQSKHNILCSELKQLYVAITRTRQRLWICENNLEVSEPMLAYWRKLSLVQMREVDDSFAEAMQRASTPEEWKSKGMMLCSEKNYEMATLCFEKAGDETLVILARASGLKAAANKLHGSNSVEATTMLKKAAKLFFSINKAADAAECFIDMGDYQRAGEIYWHKASKPGKAGQCFSLAGKYELVAQVYASENRFSECLSACTKGGHFDLALRFIEEWKQQASSDSVMQARLVDIDRILQEFLEDCAQKSHKAKDNASLMKYVRAFSSTESQCNFLISLDCFEELLVLEEELGNFHKASEIAKSVGDTLREVDLLEKAGHLYHACSLLLSYVISNDLWGSGNQGWPLKSSPQKVELLNRVMSIAHNVSETFHDSVCALANILLYDQKDLSELMQFYNSSKQYGTQIGEILVLRKLLDVHFKANVSKYEWDKDLQLDPRTFCQRMAFNEVSIGSLVYLWNLWKERSLEISGCLKNLERTDSIKLEGVVELCFNFFGLRLIDNSSVKFHLLNPDAAWAKDVEKYIQRNKNVATLEACHFATAAHTFWHHELVVLGLSVLDALQRLHNISKKSSPLYCQSMCLLHIFDISKFLLDSESFIMKQSVSKNLQKFINQCLKYFDFVFPFDTQESLSGDLIALRETELSSSLLEECVYTDIGEVRELSSGKISRAVMKELSIEQIGRAVMTFLGCGKLKYDLYNRIAARIPDGKHWKSLVKNLREIGESPLRCSSLKLSGYLRSALVETFDIYQKTPGYYISLPCFLYLLERLETLVCYARGFFFTRKSAFVECLVPLQPNANPRTGLGKQSKSIARRSTVDFVLEVVDKLLNSRSETAKWIKRSGQKYNSYIRVLVLRLLMILCTFTLNEELEVDLLYQMMKRGDIVRELPKDFYETLRPTRLPLRDEKFISEVATAFKLVGDPLLIVVAGGINPNHQCPDAVVLTLKPFSSKTDILTVLFPRSTEASHDILPSNVVLPPIVSNVVKNTRAESSEMASEINSMSSENVNWKLVHDIAEELPFFATGDIEPLKNLHLSNKVLVEEHINLLGSSLAKVSTNADLVEDLSTLVSLLRRSEYYSSAMTELAGRMLKKMPIIEAWRIRLDDDHYERTGRHFYDSMSVDDDEGAGGSRGKVNVDDEGAGGSQGKVNKKKKNKPKKGKGGKRK